MSQYLECFAYFRPMRSYRLVTDETITPSWLIKCLAIEGGYNFESSTHCQIQFGNLINGNQVLFNGCGVNREVFQTFEMENKSDMDHRFDFRGTNGGLYSNFGPFTIFPRYGILRKGETKFLMARFFPNKPGVYDEELPFYVDGWKEKSLLFHGKAFLPDICLVDIPDNILIMKPAYHNTHVSRILHLKNNTEIDTYFHVINLTNPVEDT
jgi:hypothetical protein